MTGDKIWYESPCVTYTFNVEDHDVLKEGTPVCNTSGPTLTMVTCWPTNASWFRPSNLTWQSITFSLRVRPARRDRSNRLPSMNLAPGVRGPRRR